MPIIFIKSLPPANLGTIPEMISEIRASGAKALRCPESNVWVVFQPVQPAYYVQADDPAIYPNDKTHPPLILVKAQSGRSMADKEAFVRAVATAVAHGLSISSKNVWIHYEEMQPQDIWFDGRWTQRF